MLSKYKILAKIILSCVFVFSLNCVSAASGVAEATVIGKVESLFNNRVSLKILQVTHTNCLPGVIATGSWVSFDLPNDYAKGKRNDKIKFGSVIETELIGNSATEYALTTDGNTQSVQSENNILLWTAQTANLVKNQSAYLPKDEIDKNKKKRRSNKPIRIYTSQETVRGVIASKNGNVYLKEKQAGRRGRGLQILGDEWKDKMLPYVGNTVVMYGTTNRSSVSSGTIDISTVMKIYSK